MAAKVYILDDDPIFAKLVAANLGRAGEFKIEIFEDPEELLERRAQDLPDVVLTDLVMPGMDGIEVTRRLRAEDPHLPIFVLTAHGEIESAVEALKSGANEYLTKPVNASELATLVRRALDERPLREEAATLHEARKERFSGNAILGDHPRVRGLRQFVDGVADVPGATVLLLGESGTGKNLAARAIHYSGSTADRRFVEVNCSALPTPLLEAELFGYRKGAFTDAKDSKRGLIEVADGGTLFLDEIGDLLPEVQAKLLNFLESRSFRRLGGTDPIEVTVRLITATNRDLERMVEEGAFRADLYYRICVATHTLPSLRQVASDLPTLVTHFLTVFNQDFRKEIEGITEEALSALVAWHWPGNVRELRNVLERAMIFAQGPQLELSDLPPLRGLAAPSQGGDTGGDHFAVPKGRTLKDAEREYIRLTLDANDGNVQRAAEVLGISRKNLWEKRKRYGLLEP